MTQLIQYVEGGKLVRVQDYAISIASMQLGDVLNAKSMKQLTMGEEPKVQKATMIKAIIAIVEAELQNFQVAHKISGDAIITFAVDFFTEYKAECIEDLALMFREARRGRLGKDFNRIDSTTLFNWFREYLDMKYAEKEKQLHNKKHVQAAPIEKQLAAGEVNMVHDAISKIAQNLHIQNEAKRAKSFVPDAPSLENYLFNLKQLLPEMDAKQLTALHKSFWLQKKNNVFGRKANDDILAAIEAEMKIKKVKVPQWQ